MNVETEKIEKVLAVFRDYINQDDYLDIACTWKNGYILMAECGESDSITTGEKMCKELLYYLEGYFRETHGISFEDELLPEPYRAEFLQYARTYLDQLPEYHYLLEQYH